MRTLSGDKEAVEFMAIYQMDFLEIIDKIVEDYYARMHEKVELGTVQPSTMAKKWLLSGSFSIAVNQTRIYAATGKNRILLFFLIPAVIL